MLWEGSSRSVRSNGITGAHRKGMRLVSRRRRVIVIDLIIDCCWDLLVRDGRVIIDECCIEVIGECYIDCWYFLDGFSSRSRVTVMCENLLLYLIFLRYLLDGFHEC